MVLGLPIAVVLLLTILIQASYSATLEYADTSISSCNICTIGNNANTIQQQIAQIAKQIAQQGGGANSQNIQQMIEQ